ncbi:hypothetical protein D3C87_17530 [compost metagenome]
MNKLTIRVLLLFVLWAGQFTVYISIYELGHALWKYLGNDVRNDLGWGITMHFSMFVFAVLSFINSILVTIRIRKSWLIAFLLFAIFEMFFGRSFTYSPLRSLLLSFSVLFPLLFSYAVWFFIQKRKNLLSNEENQMIDNL